MDRTSGLNGFAQRRYKGAMQKAKVAAAKMPSATPADGMARGKGGMSQYLVFDEPVIVNLEGVAYLIEP